MIMLAAFLFLLLTAALVSPTIGGDNITPGQPLSDDGVILISAGSRFALGFFSPIQGSDNRYVGIWYYSIADRQTVVWVANRQRPVVGRSGRLSLTSNGTLIITDGNLTVIWSSSSPAVGSPEAQLHDDGNFVVRDGGDSSAVWQSFDFPTDTLLAGMRLGWNLTSRHRSNLTAWKSDSDPAPGDYVAGIDLNGDPQLYIFSGTHKYWRGGPWNGERFVGTEGMKRDSAIGMYFKFVTDPSQLFYSYYSGNSNSIVNRVVMNSSGTMSNLLWVEERKMWSTNWFVPRDECDTIARCGPYGVCHPEGSTLCGCLQGFLPRNPQDGSDGCVRKTALDCHNGTDGFAVQSIVKLPDTVSSMVDWSASLEQCRDRCLKNCSCTAYAPANISGGGGGGGGCIIWTTELTDIKLQDSGSGQDLYVRLAASDLGSESTQSRRSHMVIIISLLLVLAIFPLAGGAYCVWKRRKSIGETQEDEDFDLPLFNLATIVDATGNFKLENKLGEGGFGPVYKGKLSDGHEIAVKRLSKTSSQGVDEFKNEVLLIAKLQHRNLVRLLGCCIQGGERMLIYEYMPNGSLDSFLFDDAKSALLGWQTRFNIIVGIARALLYLHHDSRLTIIHRDLKTSNVLLDKDMNPKISDFGMARIFGGDDTEVNTLRVVGTYGYMSPEYAMNGIFSIKSDVFSFGVLVLEIITGIRNRGNHGFLINQNLLEYVWSLWKEDRALDAIDRTIGKSFHKGEVLSCIKIGLLCVQERPGDRPTIYSVVKMLGNDRVLLPEPKEPSIFTLKTSSEASSSTSKRLTSVNNMSMTILNPR